MSEAKTKTPAKSREAHIAAQAMHTTPAERYEDAISRNIDNFLARKGATETRTADTAITYFMGMEVPDLKHHLGVRKNDSSFDPTLSDYLAKNHAHAKKAGLKSTFKKRGGHAQVDGVLNDKGELIQVNAEDETVAKNLLKVAPLPGNVPLSDNFGNAEADDTAPVKKVNPKKLARQQALEKSGTARTGNTSQKQNADAKRAEFMASQKQREPRLLGKRG